MCIGFRVFLFGFLVYIIFMHVILIGAVLL